MTIPFAATAFRRGRALTGAVIISSVLTVAATGVRVRRRNEKFLVPDRSGETGGATI